jgi:hypothetical protein
MQHTTPPVISPRSRPDKLERFLRWMIVCGMIVVVLLASAVYVATGIFRSSSQMTRLATALGKSSACSWDKRISVKLGWFNCMAGRFGLSFVDMEPEAATALRALRGCEVAIYQSPDEHTADRAAMLASADSVMNQSGWERIVGVIDDDNLVGVYVQADAINLETVDCFVLVMEGQKLVLASVRIDVGPLAELTRAQLRLKATTHTAVTSTTAYETPFMAIR